MTELLNQAEILQNLLVSRATGGDADQAEYIRLRQVFLSGPRYSALLPEFVRSSRSLDQFWAYIKPKFETYAERKKHIWSEFNPLLEHLDQAAYPTDDSIATTLDQLNTSNVQAIWAKCLERRQTDPEGAITAARTLLETVCKHILDELSEPYEEKDDLPQLYKQTSQKLNLAPSQHTEKVFKQILGGCTAVVEGLGSIRTKLGDAHGRGRAGPKPEPRHAELAVNLAGTLANFLVDTWAHRSQSSK